MIHPQQFLAVTIAAAVANKHVPTGFVRHLTTLPFQP
jgi:hypothetical protein